MKIKKLLFILTIFSNLTFVHSSSLGDIPSSVEEDQALSFEKLQIFWSQQTHILQPRKENIYSARPFISDNHQEERREPLFTIEWLEQHNADCLEELSNTAKKIRSQNTINASDTNNYTLAIQYYKQGTRLLKHIKKNPGSNTDKEENAITFLLQAAKLNYSYAIDELGEYFDGVGNYEESLKYYNIAAKQDHTEAQYNLGLLYLQLENYEQGFSWIEMAARIKDHPAAQYELALCYKLGRGTSPNISLYLEWLQRSANNEYPDAEYMIALHFKDGLDGVEQSDVDAFQWFTAASLDGHIAAQYELSYCYQNGIGTNQNDELAIYWKNTAQEIHDNCI